MTARYGTEFSGEHWLVVDRHADGQVVAPFDPGDRGRRAAEADCRRRNAARSAPAGVRSMADLAAVVANVGYQRRESPAPFHQQWVAGEAEVFLREDPPGRVVALVRCPGWTDDARVPGGMPLDVVAAVVEAARGASSATEAAS